MSKKCVDTTLDIVIFFCYCYIFIRNIKDNGKKNKTNRIGIN